MLHTCANLRELTVIPAPSGGYTTSSQEHSQPSKGIYTSPSKGSLLGGGDLCQLKNQGSTVSIHTNIELQKQTYKSQVHFSDHDSGAHNLVPMYHGYKLLVGEYLNSY